MTDDGEINILNGFNLQKLYIDFMNVIFTVKIAVLSYMINTEEYTI